MIRFHIDRQADVTVAALPVPLPLAGGFGIIEADNEDRIVGFDEKPMRPKPMPGDPERAYSSMGNYLFNTRTLYHALTEDAHRPGSHDFGRDILPRLISSRRVVAYNFLQNEVPGLRPYEERGYWRDIGTVEAHWRAHMDLLGETPRFDLQNPAWPIFTDDHPGPAASVVRSRLDEVMIGTESRVIETDLRRSVIGRNVFIEPGAVLEECVVFDDVHIGAKSRLRKVIVDRANRIPPHTEIGFNSRRDAGASDIVILRRPDVEMHDERRSGDKERYDRLRE